MGSGCGVWQGLSCGPSWPVIPAAHPTSLTQKQGARAGSGHLFCTLLESTG